MQKRSCSLSKFESWQLAESLVSCFQITSSRELHTLTIPEVFKEDAGNFMVKATNAAGEAKCYATLMVKVMTEKHVMKTRLVESSHTIQKTTTIAGHVAPEFTSLFKDMRVKPGEPCKMEVAITGTPKPKVRKGNDHAKSVTQRPFMKTVLETTKVKVNETLGNIIWQSYRSLPGVRGLRLDCHLLISRLPGSSTTNPWSRQTTRYPTLAMPTLFTSPRCLMRMLEDSLSRLRMMLGKPHALPCWLLWMSQL